MDEEERYAHNKAIITETPWFPEVESEEDVYEEIDIELKNQKKEIQQRIRASEFPPIFAKFSWTKSLLEKDIQKDYRPSETIGKPNTFLSYILIKLLPI